MGMEGDPQEKRFRSEPFIRSPLPPDLRTFLATQEFACVTHATDQGAVYVIKAPGQEIGSVQGRVPIGMRHELYQHPAAPVIRTVIRIHDRPNSALALETYINVAEPDQWADFAALAEQERLFLLFYDEGLTHRLTKQVDNTDQETMRNILNWADRVRESIPDDDYDFDLAKAAVMRGTRL